jgi:hypothetical protein
LAPPISLFAIDVRSDWNNADTKDAKPSEVNAQICVAFSRSLEFIGHHICDRSQASQSEWEIFWFPRQIFDPWRSVAKRTLVRAHRTIDCFLIVLYARMLKSDARKQDDSTALPGGLNHLWLTQHLPLIYAITLFDTITSTKSIQSSFRFMANWLFGC